jgi:FMN phosphatase YigB (HAD superfamily)
MPIRAITFDWGDTLAANHGMPYVATQRRAFTNLGVDLQGMGLTVPDGWVQDTIDELETQFRITISAEHNPENREMDMVAMLNRWISQVVNIEVDASQLRCVLDRCTSTLTDTVIPYAEAAPALSLLKARGYRLGVLSHVPWPGDACRAWFERNGLAGYFDFYSLSSEVGWIKPHPKHFRHALDQAGCAAHEILHVGDHPHRDIEGARAAGFKTCLRHTENIYPLDALQKCKPDAEILRLRELVDVAQRLSA